MWQYQAWRNSLLKSSRHPAPAPGPASHPLLASQTSGTPEQQPGSRFLHLHREADAFVDTAQPNLLLPPVGSYSWSSTDIAPRTAASDPANEKTTRLSTAAKSKSASWSGERGQALERPCSCISTSIQWLFCSIAPHSSPPEPPVMFNPSPWRHVFVAARMGGGAGF